MRRIVVLPDIHTPNCEYKALNPIFQFIKFYKPDTIIQLGDFCDWDSVSSYDPHRESDIQTIEHEIDSANQLLDEIDAIRKNIKKIMIGGNHEARYEQFRINQGMLVGIRRMKSLSSWDQEYNLYKRGWEKYDYGEHVQIGKLVFTHGWYASGNAAQKMAQCFPGRNVIFGHCFYPDTEVLTNCGWKLIKDVSENDVVMTLNMQSGYCEWNDVIQSHKRQSNGEMIHFKNCGVDIMVTPEHGIVYKTTPKNPLRKCSAESVAKKRLIYIPNSGKNCNKEYEFFTDNDLRLMAWIITEGNIEKNKYVRISQSDKPKIGTKRITNLLDDMGMKYSIKKRYSAGSTKHDQHRNYDAFRIYIKTNDHLLRLLKSIPKKTLEMWMLDLSNRQFSIFYEELLLGDGHRRSSRLSQYCTKNKIENDIFQAMLAINGHRSISYDRRNSYSKTFAINAHTNGYTIITSPNNIKRVSYSGDVYCLTVKNGTLLTRRNGRVSFCGNTHQHLISGCMDERGLPIESESIGTLSRFDLSYLKGKPPVNWIHAFMYIDMKDDGTFTKHFVRVINGSFIEYGREFK